MPTAPVDDKGTVLYYEDTGVPNGLPYYLTIVLVHGLTFHSGIFRRVLPYAAIYNLRIVTVNMRDYPGSTGYTPEELDALADPDVAIQDAALRAHGEQLAAFLVHLVKTHEIQPAQIVSRKRANGVALVTWSMGNLLGMAFLGNAMKYHEETRDFLAKYLRTVVMYDSSNSVLGRPRPEGVYHPLRDMSLSLQERGEVFELWVSSYFEQVTSLDLVTTPFLAARNVNRGPSKLPTLEHMSKDELDGTVDHGVFARSSSILLQVAPEVLYANCLRALVDTEGIWPDVDVLLLWCDESMHDCLWASKFVAELARVPPAEGKQKRQIEVERLEGANHFAHWDAPEAFVKALAMRL